MSWSVKFLESTEGGKAHPGQKSAAAACARKGGTGVMAIKIVNGEKNGGRRAGGKRGGDGGDGSV